MGNTLTYHLRSTAYRSSQYWGRMWMLPLKDVSSREALPVLCVPSRLFDAPRGEADFPPVGHGHGIDHFAF